MYVIETTLTLLIKPNENQLFAPNVHLNDENSDKWQDPRLNSAMNTRMRNFASTTNMLRKKRDIEHNKIKNYV